MFDAHNLYEEFEHERFDLGYKWNKDGSYTEWINNHDARVIFEEVYQIKEDIKALIESDAIRAQQGFDEKAWKNEHF